MLIHLLSVLLGSVKAACGQVLYESHPLGYLDLFLFRQLTRRTGDVRRRVVDRGSNGGALLSEGKT